LAENQVTATNAAVRTIGLCVDRLAGGKQLENCADATSLPYGQAYKNLQ